MNTLKILSKYILIPIFLLSITSWGFFAHKHINHQAIFSLPLELMPFYKSNIHFITEHAVDPDKRRYAVKSEASKHFLDLDHYPEIKSGLNPMSYYEALELYSEDTLQRHGMLPWNILRTIKYLEQAFKDNDEVHILKYSTDLGHYIGDAHVPLHTTSNYNGQLTNQVGIHGLWESRLPELYFQNYNLWIGQAQYLQSPKDSIWKCIFESNALVEKVLSAELDASAKISENKKYSIHYKNGNPIKTYSPLFCKHYQALLGNMVETRLRKSIQLTADCWYTCWVNAGKPTLTKTKVEVLSKKENEEVSSVSNECIH